MNRAERRRQRHEGEKGAGRGFDPRQPAGGQIVALMRALDRKLQIAIRRRSVSPLMDFVYSSMTGSARIVGDVPIACRRGCSHCCHSWVDAGPAEVLFAVKSMAPEQRTTAIEAVERMCGKTGGQGFDARTAMVTPCPLLQGNLCSVYESRPVVCRAAASADAEACRRAYLELGGGNIPVPTAWRALGQAYAAALEGAALHAGLVPTAREWNESLRIALTDARAEVRWLSGEDVFRGASQASATGTFSAPAWGEIYKEAFGSPPPS